MKTPFLAIGLVILMGGCTTTVVKLNSVAQPEAEKAIAYRIQPANTSLDPDSLGYREAERFVKTALSGKGLYEAPKPEMADILVSLDYSVSAPIPTEMRVPGTAGSGLSGPGEFGAPAAPILRSDISSTSMTVINYVKHLRLSAEDNKNAANGQPREEIWRIDASSEGENRDLRKALPVLVAATIEYVGKDTRGEKTIWLKDGDENGSIAFVKKGL